MAFLDELARYGDRVSVRPQTKRSAGRVVIGGRTTTH
jgi:hypothetical protein